MHLREIYKASAAHLVAQLYGLTGDFAEAQDAVQEAFARALARPSRLRGVDNPAIGGGAYAIPGGYAEPTNSPNYGIWLSPDGGAWTYVPPPPPP